ncbi:optic atrophy 3 protein homolog [Ptychodera flava]|uniref:optic atrophy 3 protein homolog n=1 Tax=Ptychodera flava TaxID=63121 RepID=UPI003969FFDA
MVVGAFPLAKLASLAVRQISKPIANYLKEASKKSEFFRRRICMPPAQLYHWSEINIKMRILGLGKAKEVKPLSESAAVELGAEIIGETFIFTVGVGVIVAEFWRQSRNEQHKEDQQNDSIKELYNKVEELGLMMEQQDARLRELNRRIASLDHGRLLRQPDNAKGVSQEKIIKEKENQNAKSQQKSKGWFG